MGTIRKMTNIVPQEWRALAGDTEVEWLLDGEKINCGTTITVTDTSGKQLTGRFEIADGEPYLAGQGLKIVEGMLAEFG